MISNEKNNHIMKMLLSLRREGIIDHKILSAITSVDREFFLPEHIKGFAMEEGNIEIFDGVNTSKTSDLAKMIFLALKHSINTDVVLEIGTGSGLMTAILSKIYTRVYSIEINKNAYDFTKSLFNSYSDKILIKLSDGKNGWKEVSPFDAIYIDACVDEDFLEPLMSQLANNGVLVFAKKYMDNQFYCLKQNKNNFSLFKSDFKVTRSMLI